ncbi:hypothetical protein BS17DRAFT_867448 [Gyrodon lividus]|nr:hypothetical protein BS17DRAFT_867448 [Gyrodon lividus]
MDVNSVRLTPVKQAEYMKKGLCFIYGKQGHCSTDHKNGRLPQKTSSPQPTPIKTVEIPTKMPSSVEKFISELQKNNVSEAEMLDVLKVCFENPKQDAPDALPITKIRLDGQDF